MRHYNLAEDELGRSVTRTKHQVAGASGRVQNLRLGKDKGRIG